jgi:hypothetical protein
MLPGEEKLTLSDVTEASNGTTILSARQAKHVTICLVLCIYINLQYFLLT